MQAISVKERKTGISEVSSCGGIYLTFALSNRENGIELLKVRKIVCITTSVPRVYKYIKTDLCSSYFFPGGILFPVPHYVKGIIKLHQRVIPIIDLRLKSSYRC